MTEESEACEALIAPLELSGTEDKAASSITAASKAKESPSEYSSSSIGKKGAISSKAALRSMWLNLS